MTNKILTVECEYCGWSLRYSAPDQIGGDSYHDVRARVCRHERRCPENPLVKTIIGVRVMVNTFKVYPQTIDLENLRVLKEINRMTFDCFLDVEVEREKKNHERKEDHGKG